MISDELPYRSTLDKYCLTDELADMICRNAGRKWPDGDVAGWQIAVAEVLHRFEDRKERRDDDTD